MNLFQSPASLALLKDGIGTATSSCAHRLFCACIPCGQLRRFVTAPAHVEFVVDPLLSLQILAVPQATRILSPYGNTSPV